jgi:hypothetical protein
MGALVAVITFLLAVVPGAFLLRDTVQDPIFVSLDQLSIPAWANLAHEDASSGNRFCVKDCELAERAYQSGRPTAATDTAFQQALLAAGWRHRTAGCPSGVGGRYSCWQHDQYVLDLWTRDANCSTSEATTAPVPPGATIPAMNLPLGQVTPAPGPNPTGPPTANCPLSQVTVKVAHSGDPHWHT